MKSNWHYSVKQWLTLRRTILTWVNSIHFKENSYLGIQKCPITEFDARCIYVFAKCKINMGVIHIQKVAWHSFFLQIAKQTKYGCRYMIFIFMCMLLCLIKGMSFFSESVELQSLSKVQLTFYWDSSHKGRFVLYDQLKFLNEYSIHSCNIIEWILAKQQLIHHKS